MTQATVSRDLRELRLEKTHDPLGRPRYVPPDARRPDPAEALARVLAEFGRSARAAQNIVVVHSELGSAPAIARALDRVEHELIVGTLAGDDTVPRDREERTRRHGARARARHALGSSTERREASRAKAPGSARWGRLVVLVEPLEVVLGEVERRRAPRRSRRRARRGRTSAASAARSRRRARRRCRRSCRRSPPALRRAARRRCRRPPNPLDHEPRDGVGHRRSCRRRTRPVPVCSTAACRRARAGSATSPRIPSSSIRSRQRRTISGAAPYPNLRAQRKRNPGLVAVARRVRRRHQQRRPLEVVARRQLELGVDVAPVGRETGDGRVPRSGERRPRRLGHRLGRGRSTRARELAAPDAAGRFA